VEQQTAQFYNLLYFLPTALGALPFHFKNGQIEKRAVLPAALCGCAAAACGAWLATAIPPELLRRIFGGFLLLIGLRECLYRPPKA
ncbi:MAG: TSUP family transporter, partial [Oscillospiraceae bacterium]|nr:TSUP family transporter [Oscillospiraceae bacterium]